MIYVLIPVYNEAVNLEDLIKDLDKSLKAKKEIIIVDDGSTDGTIKKLTNLSKKYPVSRIGYKKNRGAGHAFKFGFNYIIPRLKKKDLVVTMEGDNTTDYNIIQKMLSLAKTNKVVVASPHAKGGSFKGVSPIRVYLSKLAALIDAQVFRVKNIKTYSSFYRVYPPSSLIKLRENFKDKFITNDGFSAGVEILIRLNKVGVKMNEVPSVVNWEKRKGKSKMNLVKNIRGHFSLYKDYLLGRFS